jgi:hypothetical protein
MTPDVAARWRRRFLRWGVYLGLLLTLYGGTYYWLSRRGIAEIQALGGGYFFYCPLSDLERNNRLPIQHGLARLVFDPINQIDRAWFAGSVATPCANVTWGLSKE